MRTLTLCVYHVQELQLCHCCTTLPFALPPHLQDILPFGFTKTEVNIVDTMFPDHKWNQVVGVMVN